MPCLTYVLNRMVHSSRSITCVKCSTFTICIVNDLRHYISLFPPSKPPITSSCRLCLWAGLSAQVKGLLDASEQQTQTISVLGNVGLWTNIVGGLVYDKYDDPKCLPPHRFATPILFLLTYAFKYADIALTSSLIRRYGPKVTLVGGGAMAGAGYALMWAALKHRWSSSAAAVAWFLAGHGSGWIYVATLFANLKNFPAPQRGYVVGVRTLCQRVLALVHMS